MNANYRHAYKLLNLPRSSDWQQAKTNYRRLVQTCHPDKFDASAVENSIAHEKFLEINNAYDLLQAFYREHQKLPLEPDTLSDSEFSALHHEEIIGYGKNYSPRKRNRNKSNKGTASKLSFAIGLAMVLFLLLNSAKDDLDTINIEGDIVTKNDHLKPTTHETPGWSNQLGTVSKHSRILGTSSTNVSDSLNGRLFERNR